MIIENYERMDGLGNRDTWCRGNRTFCVVVNQRASSFNLLLHIGCNQRNSLLLPPYAKEKQILKHSCDVYNDECKI